VKLLNLNIQGHLSEITELKYTSLIKMVILEENFKWHLEAFASLHIIYDSFRWTTRLPSNVHCVQLIHLKFLFLTSFLVDFFVENFRLQSTKIFFGLVQP